MTVVTDYRARLDSGLVGFMRLIDEVAPRALHMSITGPEATIIVRGPMEEALAALQQQLPGATATRASATEGTLDLGLGYRIKIKGAASSLDAKTLTLPEFMVLVDGVVPDGSVLSFAGPEANVTLRSSDVARATGELIMALSARVPGLQVANRGGVASLTFGRFTINIFRPLR